MYAIPMRCRQILAAAKDGRAEDAAAVLESMEAAGLPPGPRAFHGVICAHCKARDTDSALAAVRKAVLQGARSPHMSPIHAQQACVSCCVDMPPLHRQLDAGPVRMLWLIMHKISSVLGP
jgi:hypothetical protein